MKGKASEGESTRKCKEEAYETQAFCSTAFEFLEVKELLSVILLCFRKVFSSS